METITEFGKQLKYALLDKFGEDITFILDATKHDPRSPVFREKVANTLARAINMSHRRGNSNPSIKAMQLYRLAEGVSIAKTEEEFLKLMDYIPKIRKGDVKGALEQYHYLSWDVKFPLTRKYVKHEKNIPTVVKIPSKEITQASLLDFSKVEKAFTAFVSDELLKLETKILEKVSEAVSSLTSDTKDVPLHIHEGAKIYLLSEPK